MTDVSKRSWRVVYGDRNHVVPVEDLVDHDLSESCWCVPRADGVALVHNSADGREIYERNHWTTFEMKPERLD